MKKLNLFLITIVLSLSCLAQTNKGTINTQIDAFIKKEMKDLGIPGVAVAVIKNGKVLHTNTYGMANLEWQQPVTPHTSFQIASVTKLFTSTLLLKWIQEGKINLDDHVSKYLPDCPDSWKPVTIRHLTAHESGIKWPAGLGGYLGIGSATNFKVETSEDLIKGMKDSTLAFQPGAKQAYQNGDYFVLQYILEKMGGKPIEQLLPQEVLRPLQMNDGGFDEEIRSFPFQTMMAVSHKSQNFTKGKTAPLIFKGFYARTSYASGGMFLSIDDATKWAVALDKEVFLTKATQEQITVNTASGGGFTQLGWTSEVNHGHLLIGHSGGPGMGDIIRMPKEKLTIIVLSNYADMYPYMAAHIAQLLVKDLEFPDAPKTFDRNLVR
ncbi:serine hydrolase domain-containing protein [Flavisolibacter tropicus]|uniref:Beta-lactamase-related domain-containing protein n=1 Tax=Flavisolibacter tropicus TaxID=1492898 RepID=A0A172TYB1_9BACT|nr:serine hydrolase domain-containing protein [Flavisolibacter tropicus]ANE52030.1 hypothetical protein SY85_17530 [Flavisolibacter tropicus]